MEVIVFSLPPFTLYKSGALIVQETPNHLDEHQLFCSPRSWLKRAMRGIPGGAVDKNLPAEARDTGSIPGPGRLHMLWGN